MTTTPYAGKARDYAACRPPYASEAMTSLCEAVGLNTSWTIADIGSGTGNVSRHLVGLASCVFAVEPDDSMRHEAEALLGSHPGFVSVTGTAEATTLADRSIDLIVVGQALHWFDAAKAHQEFDRILKSDGWFAVVWNSFGAGGEPDLSAFLRSEESVRLSFPMTIHETWAQFIGGARSAARTPNVDDEGYEDFERAQKAVFDARARDGLIQVEYTTVLVFGHMKRRTIGSKRRGDPRA
jgi:SAM-dependent methyltransferase